MRKLAQPLVDDGPRRKRFKYSSVLTILVGFLFAPFAWESGLIGVARWRAMIGPTPTIRTPAFDAVGRAYQWARDDLEEFCRPMTRHSTWKSSYMIPFVIFWALIAVVLLRK